MHRRLAIEVAQQRAKNEPSGYVIYKTTNGQWMGASKEYYDARVTYARDPELYMGGQVTRLPNRGEKKSKPKAKRLLETSDGLLY